jgi:hypothetical protein
MIIIIIVVVVVVVVRFGRAHGLHDRNADFIISQM